MHVHTHVCTQGLYTGLIPVDQVVCDASDMASHLSEVVCDDTCKDLCTDMCINMCACVQVSEVVWDDNDMLNIHPMSTHSHAIISHAGRYGHCGQG